MTSEEAEVELVLPSESPGCYLAWAKISARSDADDPRGPRAGERAWGARYLSSIAVPSIREQALDARVHGKGSVTPHLKGEPELFAGALVPLQERTRSLARATNADLAGFGVDHARIEELQRSIVRDWTDWVAGMTPRNTGETVFGSGYSSFLQGDLTAMRRWFAPDATLVVPGDTPFSGTFRGLPEILSLLALASDRLRIDQPELVELSPDAEALNAVFRTVVHDGDRSLQVTFRQRFWISERGQITRSVITFDDESALAAFFGAP